MANFAVFVHQTATEAFVRLLLMAQAAALRTSTLGCHTRFLDCATDLAHRNTDSWSRSILDQIQVNVFWNFVRGKLAPPKVWIERVFRERGWLPGTWTNVENLAQSESPNHRVGSIVNLFLAEIHLPLTRQIGREPFLLLDVVPIQKKAVNS